MMSFGPQIVMPGAFHFETLNDGTSLSGVHPGMFRPPISPSASSSVYLGRSTGSLYSDSSTPAPTVKRKRQWPREPASFNDYGATTGDAGFGTGDVYRGGADLGRINGGRERQYVLAGQIETPNGLASGNTGGAMEDSVYSDVDYRRALGPKRQQGEIELAKASSATTAPPSPPRTRRTDGWGSFALSTLGGVVGRVFEFCKTGVFRGFYAGGGRGYEINTSPGQQSTSTGQVWCNEHDVPTLPDFSSNTAPSGFQQSDQSSFHYAPGTPESTPPPAAKRRHIGDGTPGDELRKNWVMVQEPPERTRPQSVASQAPTSRTPQQMFPPVLHRRMSRPVSRVNTSSYARRQPSRVGHTGTVSLPNHQPASFASPRAQSPAPSPYTPSRIPIPSRPQSPISFSPARLSQKPSLIPSPSVHPKRSHQRNHSTASLASAASGRIRGRDSMLGFEDYSPRLDAEAKNLAAKRMQEEMETDMLMNDFNARLRDMIREGKEALGTTVDVELHDDMDGVDTWEDE